MTPNLTIRSRRQQSRLISPDQNVTIIVPYPSFSMHSKGCLKTRPSLFVFRFGDCVVGINQLSSCVISTPYQLVKDVRIHGLVFTKPAITAQFSRKEGITFIFDGKGRSTNSSRIFWVGIQSFTGYPVSEVVDHSKKVEHLTTLIDRFQKSNNRST